VFRSLVLSVALLSLVPALGVIWSAAFCVVSVRFVLTFSARLVLWLPVWTSAFLSFVLLVLMTLFIALRISPVMFSSFALTLSHAGHTGITFAAFGALSFSLGLATLALTFAFHVVFCTTFFLRFLSIVHFCTSASHPQAASDAVIIRHHHVVQTSKQSTSQNMPAVMTR